MSYPRLDADEFKTNFYPQRYIHGGGWRNVPVLLRQISGKPRLNAKNTPARSDVGKYSPPRPAVPRHVGNSQCYIASGSLNFRIYVSLSAES